MNKYQWPASRLTEKEMGILFRLKKKSGESICELLKRAVHIAYGRAAKDTAIKKVDQAE